MRGEPTTTLPALTDRSIASEEKRRQILDAAVRTFAEKGYHATRVGDIAEEAGVAYGLVYHYFASKEDVLETIFRETWTELLAAIRDVEEADVAAAEQLRQVSAILLRSWRRQPDLVRVLVREVRAQPGRAAARGRDRRGLRRARANRRARPGGRRVPLRTSSHGSRAGSSTARSRRSSRAGCWGSCPDGDDEVALAERTVVSLVVSGLSPAAATA